MRAMTAHAACPISQLSFIAVFFTGRSRRERRQGKGAGGPAPGKWDEEFWVIAFDAFSVKSFGMTELFVDISEKERDEENIYISWS
jgi:hypothetical protein